MDGRYAILSHELYSNMYLFLLLWQLQIAIAGT